MGGAWKRVLIGNHGKRRQRHLIGAAILFTAFLGYYIVAPSPMLRRGYLQIRVAANSVAYVAAGIVAYRRGGVLISLVVAFSVFLPAAVEYGLFLTSTPLLRRVVTILRQIVWIDLPNTVVVGLLGFGTGTALRSIIQGE